MVELQPSKLAMRVRFPSPALGLPATTCNVATTQFRDSPPGIAVIDSAPMGGARQAPRRVHHRPGALRRAKANSWRPRGAPSVLDPDLRTRLVDRPPNIVIVCRRGVHESMTRVANRLDPTLGSRHEVEFDVDDTVAVTAMFAALGPRHALRRWRDNSDRRSRRIGSRALRRGRHGTARWNASSSTPVWGERSRAGSRVKPNCS